VNGAKLSKSAGTAVSPHDLAERHGTDAVRWWLLRDVAALGDTDFTEQRLLTRYHQDLANGLGNLVHRTVSLVHARRQGTVPTRTPTTDVGRELVDRCALLPAAIDRALSVFDLRAATGEICAVVSVANRLIDAERPWDLARGRPAGDERAVLAVLAVLASSSRRAAASPGN
jgi:methionyl-tRNA synthetase